MGTKCEKKNANLVSFSSSFVKLKQNENLLYEKVNNIPFTLGSWHMEMR